MTLPSRTALLLGPILAVAGMVGPASAQQAVGASATVTVGEVLRLRVTDAGTEAPVGTEASAEDHGGAPATVVLEVLSNRSWRIVAEPRVAEGEGGLSYRVRGAAGEEGTSAATGAGRYREVGPGREVLATGAPGRQVLMLDYAWDAPGTSALALEDLGLRLEPL